MQQLIARIHYILLESDPSLAGLMFGFSLLVWGFVAIIIGQQDLTAFAGPLSSYIASWVWALNYSVLGLFFIMVSVKNFPTTLSLLVGSYACLVWSWIASIRDFPVLTSGITLNIFVIVMGALLIIRSRRKCP